MEGLFTTILNISISATFLAVVCLLVRTVFRRMPKYIRCFMWMLVFIRLAVPLSIESDFSLLPAKEYIAVESEEAVQYMQSERNDVEVKNETTVSMEYNDVRSDSADNAHVGLMSILAWIWLMGAATAFLYAGISYVMVRRRVCDAVRLKDNIFQSDRIETAFVFGFIRPRIYIPYGMDEENFHMILQHEQTHIKRGDHLIKPLGFLIAAVYWFNPVIRAVYVMLSRDIELACDEKVISIIGFEMKKSYSQALLDMSVPRKLITACPVAFGEIGTNERVKNVLKMKKTKIIIAAIAFCVCIALAIGFLTYPKENKADTADRTAAERVDEEETQQVTEAVVSEEKSDEVTEAEAAEPTEEEENWQERLKDNEKDGYPGEATQESVILETMNKAEEDGKAVTLLLEVDQDSAEENLVNLDGKRYKKVNLESGDKITEDGNYILYEISELKINESGDAYEIIVNMPEDKENNVFTEGDTGNERVWPFEGEYLITRQFDKDSHKGIDMVSNNGPGEAVRAAYSGTITEYGFSEEEGNYAVLQGDDGYTYRYTHLQDKDESLVGIKVEAGQNIGNMGSTGNSTGPHLHFEVQNGDEYIDPLTLY